MYIISVYNTRREGYTNWVSWMEWAELHVYGQVVRLGQDMALLVSIQSISASPSTEKTLIN